MRDWTLITLLQTAASLAVAFVLGTAIGAERQYRQRTAGLRTNVLVATGAAAFVDLGSRLTGTAGAVQIVAYIVTGVGFLGAGVIMKEGGAVRGLNTAATLWCSAAVGAFSGAGQWPEAMLMTVFVLAGNTLLRPLVNLINRAPFDERASEAVYEVRATTDRSEVAAARAALTDALEAGYYLARDTAVEERGGTEVEIVATLTATAVDPDELDALVAGLQRASPLKNATWTARTSD